jgi:hypothetical protein
VRNSRVGAHFNPLALRMVLAEAVRLTDQGEPLWDVLEAFAELLFEAVSTPALKGETVVLNFLR